MRIQFCGAAGTTTGSKHLLKINGQRILLDCGLFQGRREEALERNRKFPFDPASIDVVVLSHAHIDHSGNLPHLVAQGFTGNIYATPATRDLCSIMLPDAAHIHQHDIAWLNKKRDKQGLEPLEPSYTQQHAETAMRQFVTLGYDRPLSIAEGVTLRFINAGHILGSAQVVLDLVDHEQKDQTGRLLFSGDIGRPNNDLLDDAAGCEDVDWMILESTYGGRKHAEPAETSDAICGLVREIQKTHGKIIIPAFAVERTQQLLYTLDRLVHEGCFEPIPTFVDSPLAVRATEIFRLHVEDLKAEVREAVFMRQDPFGFDKLELIHSVEDSKQLNHRRGPAMIISASGMAESGRILHHLRNNVGDPRNMILFVGYCAEQTLGWKLREGWKNVPILGETFEVQARIETLDSFSGHADHEELLDYFNKINGRKKQIFLVHGEPSRSQALRDALPSSENSIVEIPEFLQSYILN